MNKERWESMLDRCAWTVVEGMLAGRPIRSCMVDVFNIIHAWQESQAPVDAAGVPKIKATVLERLAVEALNEVKAWRDSEGNEDFPHSTREKIESALMVYEQRRES